MAKIFLVRDGSGENRASRGKNVSIDKATEEFSNFAIHFKENGPTINSEMPVNPVSPYKHVVLEVEVGEENAKFVKAGFYLIAGLNPSVCARKFKFLF